MPSQSLPFSAKRDGQRLALGACLLDPIATATGRIGAVADLGYHALEPDLAGVGEPLGAVDLEAFAELDVGTGDDLFQLRLALMQRQLPQIVAVEIQEVESDQHDPGRLTLQLVLQHREIRRAVRRGHHDLAVDDRGRRLDVPGVVGDFLEAIGSVVATTGEHLHGFVNQVHLDAIAVELDFVDPALAAGHFVER